MDTWAFRIIVDMLELGDRTPCVSKRHAFVIHLFKFCADLKTQRFGICFPYSHNLRDRVPKRNAGSCDLELSFLWQPLWFQNSCC